MKAMIFAAGLGTRLKPLTDNMPKALVPLAGKTLLQWQIERLKAAGITEHAHYARLLKPQCDPELLDHQQGERIIAIWQGELGEYYSGHLFFRLNSDGLVEDIYLCQDNRYRFRPFVPVEEEE